MVQFVSSNAFNPLSLNLDDLYIVNVPPPSFIQGAPTDIGGLVGTASWGPTNKPTLIGSPQQLSQVFGPVGAPALSDVHDMVADAQLAILQAQGLGSSMSLVCVRVSDGTDIAASALLQDTGSNPLLSIKSLYTGIFGNQITVNVAAGAKPGTSTVTVNMPGQSGELYQNLPNSTFQQALIGALTNGLSGIRGPSQIISAALPLVAPPVITTSMFTPSSSGGSLAAGTYLIEVTAVNAQGETTVSNEVSIVVPGAGTGSIAFVLPAFAFSQTSYNIYMTQTGGAPGSELLDLLHSAASGTIIAEPLLTQPAPPTMNTATIVNTTAPKVLLYTLTGGTDGRNVNSAQLTGSDFNSGTGAQPTGAFALRGQNVSVFAISGLTDSTVWANLVPLADSEGMVLILPFAEGATSSAAIALKNSLGIDDPNVVMVKDWLFFFDQANNQVRAISPTGTYVGHIASLSPEQNIGNKLVFGIIGTDRLNPTTGSQPYTNAELSQLESNGISLITNPIPLGRDFGVRHGQNISSIASESQVEFARMTNFLDRSLGQNMGQFVAKLQSTDTSDPLRAAVRNTLNNFLAQLKNLGKIDDFSVTCDLTNNTPQTIAQHFLYAFVKVRYLSAVRFFVINLQGGTTVNVSSSSTLSGALG